MSALFSFDGLTFTFGHLFGEGLFALFFNIANASGAVRIKQECEYFAYPVGKQLAFLDIMGAFSTSIELHQLAFSLCLHPGHFSAKNLRQAPQ